MHMEWDSTQDEVDGTPKDDGPMLMLDEKNGFHKTHNIPKWRYGK